MDLQEIETGLRTVGNITEIARFANRSFSVDERQHITSMRIVASQYGLSRQYMNFVENEGAEIVRQVKP